MKILNTLTKFQKYQISHYKKLKIRKTKNQKFQRKYFKKYR